MDEYGELFIIDTEGLKFKESFTDFDEEVVIVVHLFNDLNDVGNELIPYSVVS